MVAVLRTEPYKEQAKDAAAALRTESPIPQIHIQKEDALLAVRLSALHPVRKAAAVLLVVRPLDCSWVVEDQAGCFLCQIIRRVNSFMNGLCRSFGLQLRQVKARR
jgi:hypothetical protein